MPGIAHPQAVWGWALPAESMSDADAAFSHSKRGMLGILLQQRLILLASPLNISINTLEPG
ncbi:hypothetical protein ACFQNF_20690 [Iodobacter arcticus]|uniref:Uncharacterized protein n=1 Tax=Iodobacter arcticus TaxID=590593 RepID=A0ABW2R304_9NEIS